MKCIEFGNENRDVVILLHGGGLSWWNYKTVAEKLRGDCHVVLPILDGHAGSDRDFSTIGENAGDILNFIDERFGGRVCMMGGLSLGGQVLLEILSRRGDVCRHAFVESACVCPSKLTHALVRPAFASCYGLVRKRWFSKLQFGYLGIRDALFEEYYRDTCAISKENMIRFLQANALYAMNEGLDECAAQVRVFVGERENRPMRRSAEMIAQKLHAGKPEVVPKMRHGEFSINHGEEYARKILETIRQG